MFRNTDSDTKFVFGLVGAIFLAAASIHGVATLQQEFNASATPAQVEMTIPAQELSTPIVSPAPVSPGR